MLPLTHAASHTRLSHVSATNMRRPTHMHAVVLLLLGLTSTSLSGTLPTSPSCGPEPCTPLELSSDIYTGTLPASWCVCVCIPTQQRQWDIGCRNEFEILQQKREDSKDVGTYKFAVPSACTSTLYGEVFYTTAMHTGPGLPRCC